MWIYNTLQFLGIPKIECILHQSRLSLYLPVAVSLLRRYYLFIVCLLFLLCSVYESIFKFSFCRYNFTEFRE